MVKWKKSSLWGNFADFFRGKWVNVWPNRNFLEFWSLVSSFGAESQDKLSKALKLVRKIGVAQFWASF